MPKASPPDPAAARAGVETLAPVLGALAAAPGAAPEEVAARIAAAVATVLGWPADLRHGAVVAPGRDGYVVQSGAALVPVAPGWTLRIAAPEGGPEQELRAVAALAAQALWVARSGVGELAEVNRRLRESAQRRDALAAAAAAELRSAADAIDAVDGTPEARADEARRLRQLADDLDRSLHPGAEARGALRRHREGAPARVLVVDDEADAREALTMLLEPEYEVLSAADGEAAVDVARGEHPDVVLMDLFMPRLDGFQALERLRADPSTADIPVIFVSGRGDDAVKVRSLDLGAVDFLQKPFSNRELRARVQRTLRLVHSHSQLRELAQTDPLTGLANLRAFRARLEEEVKRARRYRTPLTCVMTDLDNLKPINDELGHAAGDRAIAAVAAVLREELRETDFGARYGGDEFVVLLPHTTGEEGRIFAERACTRIGESALELSGRRVALGASFGVACLEPDSTDVRPDALVRAADAALYAAKRAGRGRVCMAPPEEGAPAVAGEGDATGAAAH